MSYTHILSENPEYTTQATVVDIRKVFRVLKRKVNDKMRSHGRIDLVYNHCMDGKIQKNSKSGEDKLAEKKRILLGIGIWNMCQAIESRWLTKIMLQSRSRWICYIDCTPEFHSNNQLLIILLY